MQITRKDVEAFLTILSESPYIDVGITIKEQFVKSDPMEVVARGLETVLQTWMNTRSTE